jgi:hypothetical protein
LSEVAVIPVPPDEIRNGLYSVIAGALAGGAPEPLWIAVDDGTDSWVAEVSKRPAAERARSVIAAGSDATLVTAHRLGVGGAMRLPPSSLAALDAFAAAAVAEPLLVPDSSLLNLIDSDLPLCLVTVNDREFWRAQLGDPAMTRALVELAAALDVPATILPWPALILAEIHEDEIIEGWTEVSAADVGLEPAVRRFSADGGKVIESASRRLLEAPSTARPVGSGEPRPVHELPHGRRVGWWSRDVVELDGDWWLATPIDVTPSKCRWRLAGDGRGGIVVDVLTSEEFAELGEVVAARLPGWAACPLRPGSPTGLLAARIADAAARRGLPFWIPNVDEEALRFVLGLPGTVWVDGPAVPR